MDIIDQCYLCKFFFKVGALEDVRIAEAGGSVSKKICKGCLNDIEVRSSMPASPNKKPKLLMEEDQTK
jgi:hypothetical protein